MSEKKRDACLHPNRWTVDGNAVAQGTASDLRTRYRNKGQVTAWCPDCGGLRVDGKWRKPEVARG